MLYTQQNEFGWTADNYGATITDAGFGTSATSDAANTMGTAVTLLAGASVTEDVYGVSLCFTGGSANTAFRRFLANLLIDPAGGTSWSTVVSNLYVNSPSLLIGGYRYYFPLYLKSGTSIGFQHQCSTTTIAMRCGVKVWGKPSRPELVKCGTKVETFGAVAGTTSGTALVPGDGVVGAYASLGTSTNDLWWWQWGGIGVADPSILPFKGGFGDVAAGDATDKKICMQGVMHVMNATEEMGKDAFGLVWPVKHIKGGETVYARASMSGAADTTPTTTAYGLGG